MAWHDVVAHSMTPIRPPFTTSFKQGKGKMRVIMSIRHVINKLKPLAQMMDTSLILNLFFFLFYSMSDDETEIPFFFSCL